MTEYTRLGPGGYPVAFQTATPTAITGTVDSSQVQTSLGRGRVKAKNEFQGAPSPGDYTWFYSIRGTVESSQNQTASLVADIKIDRRKLKKLERKKPQPIYGEVRSGQRGQTTGASIRLVDPNVGSVSSSSVSSSSGAALLQLIGSVHSSTVQSSSSRGNAERWTDEEVAAVMMLLAA